MIDAEREVCQFQHLLLIHSLHPLTEGIQLPRGIHAGYQGTHGTSCYRRNAIALCLKLLYGTDVGKSPRSTARQYECYILRHKLIDIR